MAVDEIRGRCSRWVVNAELQQTWTHIRWAPIVGLMMMKGVILSRGSFSAKLVRSECLMKVKSEHMEMTKKKSLLLFTLRWTPRPVRFGLETAQGTNKERLISEQ